LPKIISDKGSPMMTLQKIEKKGDKLEVTGALMGAWPTKMYITVDEFGGFLRVALSWSVISYLLTYPYYYLRYKLGKKE